MSRIFAGFDLFIALTFLLKNMSVSLYFLGLLSDILLLLIVAWNEYGGGVNLVHLEVDLTGLDVIFVHLFDFITEMNGLFNCVRC